MEEQPIDKLFRHNLKQAEIVPSSKAWTQLQAKQGKKKLIPMWYYTTVAASLFIICSYGWFTYQASKATNPKTVTTKLHPENKAEETKFQDIAENQKKLRVDNEPVRQEAVQLVSKAEETLHKIKATLGDPKAQNRKNVSQNVIVEIHKDILPSANLETKVEVAEKLDIKNSLTNLTKDQLINAPERTLVMNIDLRVKPTTNPIPVVEKTDSTVQKIGINTILRKIKRLKDGEILASETSKVTKHDRKGLGKIYAEVKESIRNKSAE